MSHFAVLVVGDDPETQLAPFNENDENPNDLVFEDVEDAYRARYDTEHSDMVRLESGELVLESDARFIDANWQIAIPSHLERLKVPHRDRYASFDDFMKVYTGCERDPQKQRYGYWSNPNAKWDWYSLGGRWTGFFKLRPGAIGEVGKPGVMTESAKPGYADQAHKRDIDFAGMQAEYLAERLTQFDRMIKVVAGRTVPTWKSVRAEYSEGRIDEARQHYHALPVIRDLTEHKLMPILDDFHEVYCNLDRDRYIQQSLDSAVTTFAVLMNGEWYQRGEMLWFATVADEKAVDAWNTEFRKLLDGISDDTLLSVYDCHI